MPADLAFWAKARSASLRPADEFRAALENLFWPLPQPDDAVDPDDPEDTGEALGLAVCELPQVELRPFEELEPDETELCPQLDEFEVRPMLDGLELCPQLDDPDEPELCEKLEPELWLPPDDELWPPPEPVLPEPRAHAWAGRITIPAVATTATTSHPWSFRFLIWVLPVRCCRFNE